MGYWNIIVKRVVKKVEGIVAISNGVKAFFIKHGLSQGDVIIAHDGVDLKQFDVEMTREEARSRLGLAQNKKIAMYVGLFDEWKGYRVLLEAAQELIEKNVYTLMIGGTDNQVARLKQLYPHVNFVGYKPYKDLPLNQKAADVLVIPNSSKSEVSAHFTSPLKLFSYMASGRPVVASDVPSLREVLKNDVNALLVEPDNPNALAKGILKVVEQKSLASRLSAKALEDVAVYTWDNRVEKIINFLHQ